MDDNNELEESHDAEVSRGSAINNSNSLMRFRNYKPQTNFLDGLYTVDKSQPGSISELIKDKLDLISDGNLRIDPKILEPKKIDWDLKRRLEKRLDLLEKETRNSISKHIKDARRKR